MLLKEYPSIRGEYLSGYDKKATWNLFHAYIYAHSQILIFEYPGDGVQAISRLQYKCENMTFDDQRRYNRLFQKATHKVGESAINDIKIFHSAKVLEISLANRYSEYHLMHNFLDNVLHDGKYSARIAIHQA